MVFSRRVFAGLCAALMCFPLWSWAASGLPQPAGEVLLRITGAISAKNSAEGVVFDHDMLRALDWVKVESHTSFTEGPQVFEGPTLSSVLAAVGASGTALHARAVNDYTTLIPLKHAAQHNVILAMYMNGKPMRVRDKGPIWVVYPMDAATAEKAPFDGEMIWQLVQIRVE